MNQTPAPFSKFHGTGNDFVVVDATNWSIDDVVPLVGRLCDRHRGIGADGVLVVETRREMLPDDAHASMQVVNRDGSRPQMCGNGIRCVARYLVEHKGLPDELRIVTDAGLRSCRVERTGLGWQVDVDMGNLRHEGFVEWEGEGRTWRFAAINVGNPHAVVFETAPSDVVDRIGHELNTTGIPFPEGVNVEFVDVTDDGRLDVVVYERGVGRTQACGTGACAVAFAAWKAQIVTAEEVVVGLPGGDLHIRKDADRVWMRGDAVFVFEGALSADWSGSPAL